MDFFPPQLSRSILRIGFYDLFASVRHEILLKLQKKVNMQKESKSTYEYTTDEEILTNIRTHA